MEASDPQQLSFQAGDLKIKAPAKPRQNKTPLQKEVLEASYQLNQHPSVEHRKALGDRIGLTEQEVQAWFTNRRRRDKAAEKKAAAATGLEASPGPAAPSGSHPSSSSPLPSAGHPGAPAGTLLHIPPPASSPAAPGATSPKPKAPRAPKPPKPSPVIAPGAGLVAPSAAPLTLGMAVPAPGGPAGLARHVLPPHLTATPPVAAAISGGVSSGAVSCPEPEEETEEGDEDGAVDPAAAAAWESIRALCVAARATLPIPYREDGPSLGFFFDEPPMPGELAAAAGSKRRRIVLGNDLVAEADEEGVKSVLLRRPGGGRPGVPGAGPVGVMTVAELEMRRRELQLQQQQQQEDSIMADDPDYRSSGRKAEDAMRREQERLRRELLRQQEKLERDRKREEDERSREMERHERERKKLADKLEKDRAKEEARKLKELERMKIAEERELKRLEAAREKERKAEERRKAIEERKKEKETAKALAQQERAVLRMRHRESTHGPPDDEELEYRQLLLAAGIDPATVADAEDENGNTAGVGGGYTQMPDAGSTPGVASTPPPRKRPRPDLSRPEFPPPSLGLQPAWPGDPELDGPEGPAAMANGSSAPGEGSLAGGMGTELLVCWSFLRSFSDLLGVAIPSLEELMAALAEGEDSRVLADVHCALLRLLQADMEDAHDEKERVGRQTAAAPNFMDRSVVGSARRLEEAWAWGYDVDAWRAHLNMLTWPEVLRQMAVVAGRGRTRPHVRRAAADAGAKGPRIQGIDGEDVLDDGSTGGSLKLRMPARYVHGTVKAASWQVLSTAGPCGLSVGDMVRRIQKLGLREMRSSKTPEAVVAGSLSRDVLFTKVAPATWALSSVVAYHKRKNEVRRGKYAAAKAEQASAKTGIGGGGGAGGSGGGGGGAGEGGDGDAEMTHVVKQEPGGKEEGRVKEEGSGGARSSGGGSVSPGGVKEESQAMEVDGEGAVKQEQAVKDEAGGSGPSTSGPNDADADGGRASTSPQAGGRGGSAETGGGHQQGQPHEHDQDEDSYSGDDDDEDVEAQGGQRGAGDVWVASLLMGGYAALGLCDRVEALSFLCHAVLDGPSLRAKLELRSNEAVLRRKQVFEEAKNDKRKRQEEAAARAAAAAEEARKRAEAAAAAGGGAAATPAAAAAAGSRGSTPAPPGVPVDPKAIAGEIFGAGPQDASKSAAEAAKRAEEEEDERQKRQQRADEIRRVEEECAIRVEPLGSDRRYNRYWLFTTGADGDIGNGRLWVESAPEGTWRLLTTPQQLDALIASLEPRGAREGPLVQALMRHVDRIKSCMPGVAPLSLPTPLESLPAATRSELEAGAAARLEPIRLQASGHLEPGDDYTADLQLPEEDSARMQRLKRDLLRLEAAVPAEAVDEGFQRSAWVERVQSAGSPTALRTCLGQLEVALLPSPDGQSPGLLATVFHRHPPLVRGAWVEVGKEVATALPGPASKEILSQVDRTDGHPQAALSDEPLAWLPPTLSALTLRLLALDASLVYRTGMPGRDALCGYKYTVRPAPLDAQPAVAATAAAAAGVDPPGSAALPMAVGGGAVVLTNVLADRGRVREVNRRVPDLPTHVMTLAARDFSIPVEQMRESVAEAEKQGLLNAAGAAVAEPPPGTSKSGKGKGSAAKGVEAAASKAGSAAAGGSRGAKSVVVVSGGRGVSAGGAGTSKSKGGSKAKGGAAAGGSKSKGGKSAPRGKGAAAVVTEEAEGEDEWVAASGEQMGEPALLGPEDDDELGFSDEDDAPEEGYDDPYDSDYR